jgi:hypothetical protein
MSHDIVLCASGLPTKLNSALGRGAKQIGTCPLCNEDPHSPTATEFECDAKEVEAAFDLPSLRVLSTCLTPRCSELGHCSRRELGELDLGDCAARAQATPLRLASPENAT